MKSLTLMLFSTLFAMTAFSQTNAEFTARLRNSLSRSPLSPVEKAQHVLDRLGYGAHPEMVSVPDLLSYDQNGQIDEDATNSLIVDYVVRSMEPGSIDRPVVKGLLDSFATSELNYTEISQKARYLARKFREAKATLEATPEIRAGAYKKALDEYNEIRLSGIRFRQNLVKAQQARFIAHAVTARYPLYLKLLHLWFNRFNVMGLKAPYDLGDYLKQLNKNTFSTFHELLRATARHPAMLTYLHNSSNFVKYNRAGNLIAPPNEDYARELMELHTLGKVARNQTGPSDYNLADINQAALLLSGWHIAGVSLGSSGDRRFHFDGEKHARGIQTVMGRPFVAGRQGGEDFLLFLAAHPLTANSVARMLVRHFVQDRLWQPVAGSQTETEPLPLVLDLASVYHSTNGDLTQLYQRLFSAPEFWSRDAYRSKMKDPLHLVVSTLRATGRVAQILDAQTGAVTDAGTLAKDVLVSANEQMEKMGGEIFECPPPTGYPDTTAAWSSVPNVMSFVKYAFKEATYGGRVGGALRDSYIVEERRARAGSTPGQMADLALGGFFRSYRVNFLSPWSSALPLDPTVSPVAIPQPLLLYAEKPDFKVRDDESRALYPVRSIAGAYLGSAEFMKR